MKLGSAQLLKLWNQLSPLPFGKPIFSSLLGFLIPYTGTLKASVLNLAPGEARVMACERRRLRNHLRSMHAMALANLGEMATGLAVVSAVPAEGRAILVGFSMQYLKKARGKIVAEAKTPLIHSLEDQEVEVAGELKNEQGETVARALAKWRVGKQK